MRGLASLRHSIQAFPLMYVVWAFSAGFLLYGVFLRFEQDTLIRQWQVTLREIQQVQAQVLSWQADLEKKQVAVLKALDICKFRPPP